MPKGNKRHGTDAPKVGTPKQGADHAFGAKGGVHGPGAAEHQGGAFPHDKHKQKTHKPGRGT